MTEPGVVSDGIRSERIHVAPPSEEWWRTAVVYQIYPRSFADANGDGLGDLAGITARLPYVRDLGVDAVWISPFYPSPQADAGYDVSDYCDVDPRFGTLAEADELIETAHSLGLRIFVDLVPNHTSDEHPWFRQALSAGPGSLERARYWFVDSEELPNDWQSDFGGPTWTQVPDGQWYLHLFDSKQPDLNWENPDVREMFAGVLRFWLDRGVDGFRVDVAHGLVKAEGLPDFGGDWDAFFAGLLPTNAVPCWDQERLHDIYRQWRTILDGYPGERAMVAEACVTPPERAARYLRPDEFQQGFNFDLLECPWNAKELRDRIVASLRANDDVGAPTTWVLSNHDSIRHATRFGFAHTRVSPWLEATEPAPDQQLGRLRARAGTTLMLALPGSAYLYQGEELGLPEVIDLPAHVRQDPSFRRTSGQRLGRDGCRVPIPWEKDRRCYGFSEADEAWLPQPETFGALAVDQQLGREGSSLELYRNLLALRRQRSLGAGGLSVLDLGPDLVAVDVDTRAGLTRAVLNLGERDWPIPAGARVLVASAPGVTDRLPTDHAVWLE